MYSNLILTDSNGVTWSVSVLDSGILQNVPISALGQTILLSSPNGVVWQVAISTIGILVLTQSFSTALATQSFVMLSPTKVWNFAALNGGILQQTLQTWTPSTGLGGPALHQPPTGPNPNLAIPENAGLFGGLEFTFNNGGVGVYFSVFNPGRSA